MLPSIDPLEKNWMPQENTIQFVAHYCFFSSLTAVGGYKVAATDSKLGADDSVLDLVLCFGTSDKLNERLWSPSSSLLSSLSCQHLHLRLCFHLSVQEFSYLYIFGWRCTVQEFQDWFIRQFPLSISVSKLSIIGFCQLNLDMYLKTIS